ncbi:MAG: alpha-L-rhamnosidase C-terminal domain-containing protein [Verrucomicrobiota bacterium JB024]|nr:alpha-L-rhamnosidase C-terminal domain-containing protein [Verrucomicrobiota bacterium JB024]
MPGLDWVNVEYESLYGNITSQWKRDEGGIRWTIHVPANTSADIHLPVKLGEAIRVMANNGFVQPVSRTNEEQVLFVLAGTYVFQLN